MLATTSERNTYSLRPHLNPTDLVIAKKGSETRYVSPNLVPNEVTLKIYKDQLRLICSYLTPETSTVAKKFAEGSIKITLGRHTGMVLQAYAIYPSQSFEQVIKSVDSVLSSIRSLKGSEKKQAVKKTYEIVEGAISFLRRQILEARNEINQLFVSDGA